MRNFEAHTDDIRQQMLDEININSTDEFFSVIPKECYLNELKLPEALSEMAAQKELYKISKKIKLIIFLLWAGVLLKNLSHQP